MSVFVNVIVSKCNLQELMLRFNNTLNGRSPHHLIDNRLKPWMLPREDQNLQI